MKHIIDTDELEKLITTKTLTIGHGWNEQVETINVGHLRALIANSPQADGMANSREMFEQFATLHNMPVLKVGEAYSNDDTNYAWWVWQKALSISSDTNYADLIKQAVNRFLGWKLPSDFNPDGNINFYRQYEHNSPHYPIGTNLFTAEQAKAMFEYCLSAYKPQADDVRNDAERWRYLKDKYAMVNFDIYDAEMGETKVTGIIFEMPSGIRYSADINATIDQAIDKARE